MATGPADALDIVDGLVAEGTLARSYMLPAVRGELLSRLGRDNEARADLLAAAEMTGNQRERAVLLEKASRLDA
jgi:predicted RNA polymerase sigma factor